MNYWTGGRWLNGPKLVAWLEERVGEPPEGPNEGRLAAVCRRHPALTKRLYEWRRGGRADIYFLDAYLAPEGLHPGQIPDDVWLERDDWPRIGTHRCKRGHLMSGTNVYVTPDGYRCCRECRRERSRRYRREQGQAVAA